MFSRWDSGHLSSMKDASHLGVRGLSLGPQSITECYHLWGCCSCAHFLSNCRHSWTQLDLKVLTCLLGVWCLGCHRRLVFSLLFRCLGTRFSRLYSTRDPTPPWLHLIQMPQLKFLQLSAHQSPIPAPYLPSDDLHFLIAALHLPTDALHLPITADYLLIIALHLPAPYLAADPTIHAPH